MTRFTLTAIAIALLATCAAAQPFMWETSKTYLHSTTPLPLPRPEENWGIAAILPPAEFDQPYDGEILVQRRESEQEVRNSCSNARFPVNGRALACSTRLTNFCSIIIGPDELIARVGLTYEIVLRHEIGHCNGWPGDHPNGRTVKAAPARSMQDVRMLRFQFPK